MTYREAINDALEDIQAYATFKSLTDSNYMRLISEAIHKLQKKGHVIKNTVTVLTSALDANGAVALSKAITLPTRVTYTPTGGTQPIEVLPKGPDEFAQIVLMNGPQSTLGGWLYTPSPSTNRKLYMTVEQNLLKFWPFNGINGTFTITAYAKMPVYQLSLATDTTSYWYGWDAAGIKAKMDSTAIPQEMEDAEEGIVGYVAARLLTFIPGWKKRFADDYAERMVRFERAYSEVEVNAPSYTENYEATVNFGF